MWGVDEIPGPQVAMGNCFPFCGNYNLFGPPFLQDLFLDSVGLRCGRRGISQLSGCLVLEEQTAPKGEDSAAAGRGGGLERELAGDLPRI